MFDKILSITYLIKIIVFRSSHVGLLFASLSILRKIENSTSVNLANLTCSSYVLCTCHCHYQCCVDSSGSSLFSEFLLSQKSFTILAEALWEFNTCYLTLYNRHPVAMGERKGTNKYYPPDYDPKAGGLNKWQGTHALRERARKIHMGIIIIRFEMPYNIWCEGCNNHIGMGVRYNAEKTKVGMYYSTPVYQFKMKCHLCDNHFVIKTDPAVSSYFLFVCTAINFFYFGRIWIILFYREQDDKKIAGIQRRINK